MNSPIILSQTGLERLQSRLEEQRRTHAKLCEERDIAHELSGDGWHDNPHFNYLQQMEANSSWKIHELENLISNAQLYEVTEGKRPIERVEVGSVVRFIVIDLSTDEEREQVLEVVGFEESEPDSLQVAYSAPLGKALVGMKPSDCTETRLPQGEVYLEVIELYSSRSEAGLNAA